MDLKNLKILIKCWLLIHVFCCICKKLLDKWIILYTQSQQRCGFGISVGNWENTKQSFKIIIISIKYHINVQNHTREYALIFTLLHLNNKWTHLLKRHNCVFTFPRVHSTPVQLVAVWRIWLVHKDHRRRRRGAERKRDSRKTFLMLRLMLLTKLKGVIDF